MTWAASHSEGTLATADSELMRNPAQRVAGAR